MTNVSSSLNIWLTHTRSLILSSDLIASLLVASQQVKKGTRIEEQPGARCLFCISSENLDDNFHSFRYGASYRDPVEKFSFNVSRVFFMFSSEWLDREGRRPKPPFFLYEFHRHYFTHSLIVKNYRLYWSSVVVVVQFFFFFFLF
jgi:hypothetical protein